MAYIRNRGSKTDQTWYIRYKDPASGKWRQRPAEKVNGRKATRAEALAEATLIEADILRGKPAPPPRQKAAPPKRLTVRDLAERFLTEYSRPRIKDIAAYLAQSRYFVNRTIREYPIGAMAAEEVKPLHVQRWRDSLRAAGYSPGTVNRAMATLSRIFAWSMDGEVIPLMRNPCSRVERMPAPPSEERYTLPECHRLLERPDCPAMVWCALYTGMRKGELYGLTWAAVNLDAEVPYIDVRRSYATSPKSGRARVVPVHRDLLPVLRRWRAESPTPDGLVFPVQGAKGWRMGTERDMSGLPDLLSAAGCHVPTDRQSGRSKPPGARAWHAFRATFASVWMEQSGDGYSLSRILGHSHGGGAAAVTMGYVRHAGLSGLAAAMAKLDLLPPAPAGVTRLRDVG